MRDAAAARVLTSFRYTENHSAGHPTSSSIEFRELSAQQNLLNDATTFPEVPPTRLQEQAGCREKEHSQHIE